MFTTIARRLSPFFVRHQLNFKQPIKTLLPVLGFLLSFNVLAELRGTGDLGIVIEREAGAALIINTSQRTQLAKITNLGDLSHASVVFSRDQRYAFIFGRDGGLSKIDLLQTNSINVSFRPAIASAEPFLKMVN